MSKQFLSMNEFGTHMNTIIQNSAPGKVSKNLVESACLLADKSAMMTEIERLTKEQEMAKFVRARMDLAMKLSGKALRKLHDNRVTELLEANNREVERRREAERRVAELEAMVQHQKALINEQYGKMPMLFTQDSFVEWAKVRAAWLSGMTGHDAIEPDTPAPSADYPGGPLVMEKPSPEKPKFEFRDGDIVLVAHTMAAESKFRSADTAYDVYPPHLKQFAEKGVSFTGKRRFVFGVKDGNFTGYRVTLDPSKHRVLLHKSFYDLSFEVRVRMLQVFGIATGLEFIKLLEDL